jgi:hypothetical protein
MDQPNHRISFKYGMPFRNAVHRRRRNVNNALDPRLDSGLKDISCAVDICGEDILRRVQWKRRRSMNNNIDASPHCPVNISLLADVSLNYRYAITDVRICERCDIK